MTLDDIKDRCVITETGCWHWKGALSNGKWPRIWAPNHTKEGSPMTAQPGRRAVWHVKTGKPIPDGHRVYGTCTDPKCMNPEHMACGPTSECGAHMTATGRHKTVARTIANRENGGVRSSLNAELVAHIQTSTKTGRALAEELNIAESVVSRARNGRIVFFRPLGGPFSGLGAR